jgi:hypothetical protein
MSWLTLLLIACFLTAAVAIWWLINDAIGIHRRRLWQPQRPWVIAQRRQQLHDLEHETWPDQTPEWFNHQFCNRCSGGHTHSLSIDPGRSKVVRLPPRVGEPTTWVEVTALGDTRKYYVPGGPV